MRTASNEFKNAQSEIKSAFRGTDNKTIKKGTANLRTVKKSTRSTDRTIKTTTK